jgi:hypothetical protein
MRIFVLDYDPDLHHSEALYYHVKTIPCKTARTIMPAARFAPKNTAAAPTVAKIWMPGRMSRPASRRRAPGLAACAPMAPSESILAPGDYMKALCQDPKALVN